MIDNTTLSKATKIKIIPTHISKNNVRHFAVMLQNIPYMDKNHRIYYSEVIFHDCTFSHRNEDLASFTYKEICKYNIAIINKSIIINHAQSFIHDNQFTFEYHEKPSTTKLITIQYPKED